MTNQTRNIRLERELFEERIRGRLYRRKRGTVCYRAEAIQFDTSYLRYYNFYTTLIKLRHAGTGRALTVPEREFRHAWEEVES